MKARTTEISPSIDMKPGPSMTLHILNCTALGLFNAVHGGAGRCHSYQMTRWFEDKAADNVVVSSCSNLQQLIQFEQGGGDQDDGAEVQLNIGAGDVSARNLLQVLARSDRNSVHRVDLVLQTPSARDVGTIAFGLIHNTVWPPASVDAIEWNVGGKEITLGTALENHSQVIVADLRWLFETVTAQQLAEAIRRGTLDGPMKSGLFNKITDQIRRVRARSYRG